MRAGFVVTEALIIAILTFIGGLYFEKETNVTNYIYQADDNKTTILWVETKDNRDISSGK